jgi:hypothetical protein
MSKTAYFLIASLILAVAGIWEGLWTGVASAES